MPTRSRLKLSAQARRDANAGARLEIAGSGSRDAGVEHGDDVDAAIRCLVGDREHLAIAELRRILCAPAASAGSVMPLYPDDFLNVWASMNFEPWPANEYIHVSLGADAMIRSSSRVRIDLRLAQSSVNGMENVFNNRHQPATGTTRSSP